MGYTGKGITVAIMDDGIDYLHPDLQDNYVSILIFVYSVLFLNNGFQNKTLIKVKLLKG